MFWSAFLFLVYYLPRCRAAYLLAYSQAGTSWKFSSHQSCCSSTYLASHLGRVVGTQAGIGPAGRVSL